MSKPYQNLESIFKDLSLLDQASGILGWDSNTMMPIGSSENRGEQLGVLTKIHHQKLISNEVGDLLEAAFTDLNSLNDWQKSNLRLMKKEFDHAACVDEDLAVAITKASNKCEMLWRQCRKDNDFKGISPSLSEVIELTKKLSEVKSESLGLGKYDALLDSYDPGRKSEEIDKVFAKLESFLPDFIDEVIASQKPKPKLDIYFQKEKQRELGLFCMKQLGFNFDKGRLDESVHPFCGGTPDDARITTRYYEDDFTQSWMGIMHETGHALYEANLPKEWRYQCVGKSIGMSTHESQSLFVEKQIGVSDEFIRFVHPKVLEKFALNDNDLSFDDMKSHIQHVEKSFIRVDADEVTYPLHVIMRYRIEKQMIEGDFKVADLPGIWDDYMKKYLHIMPDSDANGCMQDTHWFAGLIGYFPTYTLGSLTAAQIMAKIRQNLPNTLDLLAKGELLPIIEWLNENIHSRGSLYDADGLLHEATGEHLNPQYFIDHVQARYGYR